MKDEGCTIYVVGTGPKSSDKGGVYYGVKTKELCTDDYKYISTTKDISNSVYTKPE